MKEKLTAFLLSFVSGFVDTAGFIARRNLYGACDRKLRAGWRVNRALGRGSGFSEAADVSGVRRGGRRDVFNRAPD